MSKNNLYLITLPEGYTIKRLSGGLNIVEYTDSYGNYQCTTVTQTPPKYESSPLWKVLNNDESEKTSELSEGRNRNSKGYNTKIKESGKTTSKNHKGTKK